MSDAAIGHPGDQLRSPSSHQFSGTDVWQLLRIRARATPDRPYVVWHPFEGVGRTYTYADVERGAASLGAGLVARGVRRGDRVLVHLENSPEFVLSWFACASVGAVAVTTNTRSAPDELAWFADDCAAVGAITQPRFAETMSNAAPGLVWQVVTDHDAGVATSRPATGELAFSSLYGDADLLPAHAPDPLAPMSVQYTSGTTARPKGVLWTHANALWGARVNAAHEDLHPDDCHLTYMPLFHTNALSFSMLASLWVGSRFVLLPKWSSSRFWDISMRYGCSWLSLIGVSLKTVARTEAPDGHSYRLFGTGLCDLPFAARLGAKAIGWWGMTETISQPIVGDPYLPNRPWSAGRPAPEYGVAVVRDDGVTPVEPDETGALLVKGTRGLSLFAEYLNQPEATADSFDEHGWFRTGDRVTPHADGHISYDSREKDMLKVGGENVAAAEIERVILAVPGLVEVAVVGRSDDRLDEIPVAFVRVVGDDDGIAERVSAACAQLLADFKVPRSVQVVREMPRATLGKINKVELRRIAEGADLHAAEKRWLAEAATDPSGDVDR